MIYRILALLMMTVFFPFVGLVILVYAAFCFYAFRTFQIASSRTESENNNEGVSVIIPFRNEANTLATCLAAIKAQKEIGFPVEVLLVDDHSEDGSVAIAEAESSTLQSRIVLSNGQGKKAAIETGIAAASHPIIYTIDADCRMEPHCLKSMQGRYTSERLHMLCGLVSYKNNGNVFSMMQQAESVALVGISAFMLNSGRPATCNGANLMFSKALFEHLGGYGSDKQLSSGDDDLLMQSFARYQPDKVRYAIDSASVVVTNTETSFKQFILQRIRWAGKRSAYKYQYNTYLMVMLLLKQVTFWMAFAAATLFASPFLYLICLVLFMSDFLLYMRFRTILTLKWYAILLMPIYQLYIPFIPLLSFIMTSTWKGRKVLKA